MAYGFNSDKSRYDIKHDDVVTVIARSEIIQPQGTDVIEFSQSDLDFYGIDDVDNYTVISSMWQWNSSWYTAGADHDDIGYPIPISVELNNYNTYPMQIHVYNSKTDEPFTVVCRIVLMRIY